MNEPRTKQEILYRWLKTARHTVFFGGAGVSTESGLADFRSAKSGIYNQKERFACPPEQMLTPAFLEEHPTEFFDFYRNELLRLEAKPNITHTVLAELERRGLLSAIITQNADGLHQRAGSRRVLDLHGNVYRNTCVRCGKPYGVHMVADCPGVPRCGCGGVIRPDIVLFGEVPDLCVVMDCVLELRRCDLLLIGGTSLKVSSAGRLLGGLRGKRMVILNNEETPFDAQADLIIRGQIGDVFRGLEKLLEGDTGR